MTSSAVFAHGTLLKIGDGGGTETFTTIAEVLDITGPSYTVNTTEVTNHDSAGYVERIATLVDPGEVSFSINYYSAATQDQLETDRDAKTKRNFQIVFDIGAQTDTREFAAYITSTQFNAPVDGVLTADITLQITGSVTKTVA